MTLSRSIEGHASLCAIIDTMKSYFLIYLESNSKMMLTKLASSQAFDIDIFV